MTTMTPQQHRAFDQAAAWVARLRADDVSAADRQAFAEWLGADPDNAVAFDRTLELWADLGVMKALPLDIPSPPATRRWQFSAALAAAAVLAAILVLPRHAPEPALELRTPVGGFRQVRLEDGSEVTLNTDTALRVALGEAERTVTMDRGEALFRVAPDAARPFSASCGNATVTVLGTAFAASCSEAGMAVVVEHGVVRFAPRQGSASTQILHAGEASRFDVREGMSDIHSTDTASALAWEQRRLVFEDAPLAEVVRELQRHMNPVLRITDPEVAAIRVSGVFSTAEPLLTLEALERSLGIEVNGPAGGPLLIARAAD